MTTLAAALQGLLPPGAAAAEADPRQPPDGLLPEEAAGLDGAVDKRRREFAAGRRAVRRAMEALGLTAHAVPRRADRAPEWPAGLTGSITHSDTGCLAVLAPDSALAAIGIDMEPDAPLTPELTELIATPDERRRLLACAEGFRRARLLFAAKEAAYKCQYALGGRYLDFHDMELELAADDSRFAAVFTCDTPIFRRGERLEGRAIRAAGHVVTCVFVPAGTGPRAAG